MTIVVAAALTAGPGPARRILTALLIVASAIVPWLLPPVPFWRALLTMAALVAFLKTTQISVTPGPWPAWRRLWHLVVLFDVRRTRRVAPSADWRLLVNCLGHAALAIGAVFAVKSAQSMVSPLRDVVRLLGGASLLYGILGGVSALYQFGHRLAGVEAPANQRAPILSRTTAEFWGDRWNRTISEWLARFVFRPVARRLGSTAGLMAAFVASGALHVWLAAPALGMRAALLMGGYFVIEGLVLLTEVRLGVRRWPAPIARAWTVVVLLVPLSLVISPFLRVFGL